MTKEVEAIGGIPADNGATRVETLVAVEGTLVAAISAEVILAEEEIGKWNCWSNRKTYSGQNEALYVFLISARRFIAHRGYCKNFFI